jgi:antitoxin HicB
MFFALRRPERNDRMALDYAVLLTPDHNGTLLVTCPDLTEVTTFGSDEADALRHAREAIEEAIAARIARRADIPLPSAPRTRQKGKAAAKDTPKVACVVLPTQTALKAMLHRAMRAQNLRKADLERRLRLHGPQVDRLLNPRHASRLDQIEAALAAVGKRPVVDVEEAA